MWSITSLILIISILNFSYAFVCPECNKSACKEVSCGLGQVARPGICSCCDECVTMSKEGEACGFEFILPSPSTQVCVDGLICFEGKCQKKDYVIGEIKEANSKLKKNP